MNFDLEKYKQLLLEIAPTVIKSEEEHKRLVSEYEKLINLDELTPEQIVMVDMLVYLIQKYEKENYQLKSTTPKDILVELMQIRNLKQKDLIFIFGSKSIVSEVINSKRNITKEQAKLLALYFNVSPELFI